MHPNPDREVLLPDQLPQVALLGCATCGAEQSWELSFEQLNELVRNGQLRLLCPACRTMTTWYGLQPDRRAGSERRTSRHARIKLPIRVRCTCQESNFTEVTTTITASRQGASFISSHELHEGMTVDVIIPYSEGDPQALEMRARVVRVEPKGRVYEIGVQILR